MARKPRQSKNAATAASEAPTEPPPTEPELPAVVVDPKDAPPIPSTTYTEKEIDELTKLAIQSTKFGPNPQFLQGQPIELVRAALVSSMPPGWREKNAHAWTREVRDPSLLVILLTYFAAYWNLGFKSGVDHASRQQPQTK